MVKIFTGNKRFAMSYTKTDRFNLFMIIILSVIIFLCVITVFSCKTTEKKAIKYVTENPKSLDKICPLCPSQILVQHKVDTVIERIDSTIYDTSGMAAWTDLARFNAEQSIMDSLGRIPAKIVYQTRIVRITDTRLYLDKATLNWAVKTAYLKGWSDRDKKPVKEPFNWWRVAFFGLLAFTLLWMGLLWRRRK